MTLDQFIDGLVELLRTIVRFGVMLASWLLDIMRPFGPIRILVPIVIVCAIAYGVSLLMQRRLNRILQEDPDAEISMALHELIFTLPGALIYLMLLPFILLARGVRALGKNIKKKRAKRQAEAGGEVADEEPPEGLKGGEEEPDPVVVATIGPTFIMAALGCAAMYVLGLGLAPLVRAQLGLSERAPVWQYLMLGQVPELHWYLPLDRYPWLGGGLIVAFWFLVWWWLARTVRVAMGSTLGANLVDSVEDASVLRFWRELVGARTLVAPDDTFALWARRLPMVAAPFLLGSFALFAGDPYRTDPSMFSLALLLALSWTMHLRLSGVARLEEEEEVEAPPEAVVAHGWEDVLESLQKRFNIRAPHLFEPPRAVEELAFSSIAPEAEGIVSPLLLELLPEDSPGLTHMQYVVLRDLALQGFVHLDPPTPRGELELSAASVGLQDMTGLRHRDQIVLAPEGAGKSTLALLASCNHAIVHTRTSLIIARDDTRALALWRELSARLEPSTLRWNIRLRRIGGDLVNDLAMGIIPDIIVCSLHQLVVNVLDEIPNYAPFLENLGLVVIDDVEDLCGPVETHAQLALRRLHLRVVELIGARELGEEITPITLALGADTMQDTPAWARALCGGDAVARYFDYSSREAQEREAAFKAFQGMEAIAKAEEEAAKEAARGGEEGQPDDAPRHTPGAGVPKLDGRHQLVYRLSDFRNPDDEAITVRDIVEACERMAVPWHYRPCGDGRRRLGRQRLHLRDEPKYHATAPEDACVVFLEGCFSEVRREIERLYRAGARFTPIKRSKERAPELFADARGKKRGAQSGGDSVPIALITIIDRDEEMALTELNVHSTLAGALATLPRPVIRPPTGRVVREHLAAELTTSWIEVADVLDIFGNPTAGTLTKLASAGMLMSEARTDLHGELALYEERVYVRATTRAMSPERRARRDAGREREPLLPPRVSQVELASGDRVAIRERTSLNIIDVTDADSAGLVYYLGRIFEHASGRFIVVGTGAQEKDKDETIADEDVLVEPFLNDGISSPRRRIWIQPEGVEPPETRPQEEAEAAIDEELADLERRIRTLDQGRYTREEGAGGEAREAGEAAPQTVDRLPVIEPVLIGEAPIAVSLTRASCRPEHIATFRLGAVQHEVRQRIVFDPEWSALHGTRTFETMALGIYPNPSLDQHTSDDDAPKLALEEARLIAAVMRALLPTMYRGASSSLEVALHITRRAPSPTAPLEPHEGFFLYDPLPGGTGAARALYRDGVELLLRLCRVYIERVLYHDRLRARFDYWGDEDEIMNRSARGAKETTAPVTGTLFLDLDGELAEDAGGEDAQETAGVDRSDTAVAARTPGAQVREHDRAVRRRALIWLDSRLRPEGSLAGGRTLGKYGSGEETGEGDVSDIGRCWFSRHGTVTDLLWAKHRWQLDDDGGEAMLDAGFDRDTVAASRFLGPDSPQLAPWLAAIGEQLKNAGGFSLDEDRSIWSTPRSVWVLGRGEEVPVGTSGEVIKHEQVKAYQLLMSAIAAHDIRALEPLAMLLRDRCGVSPEDQKTDAGRYAMIQYFARFVQGIPLTAPADPRGTGQSPVHTLLYRIGDSDAQSLVLAMLLRHCGVDTGLFVSVDAIGAGKGGPEQEARPRETLCAVAALDAPSLGAGAVMPRLRAWREEVGVQDEALIWGESPGRPGGPEHAPLIYVPVDPTRLAAPGVARVEDAEAWVFLPLGAAWFRAGLRDIGAPEEGAEDEDAERADD